MSFSSASCQNAQAAVLHVPAVAQTNTETGTYSTAGAVLTTRPNSEPPAPRPTACRGRHDRRRHEHGGMSGLTASVVLNKSEARSPTRLGTADGGELARRRKAWRLPAAPHASAANERGDQRPATSALAARGESRTEPKWAQRPGCKARGGRILPVFNRRATQQTGWLRRFGDGRLLPRAARVGPAGRGGPALIAAHAVQRR